MRLRKNFKVKFYKFKTYIRDFEFTGEFNMLDDRGFQIIMALFNKEIKPAYNELQVI